MKSRFPLVTILTPAYNVERKNLNKYFEAILKQSYRPIELIFVNDGSTDNTEAIFLKYKQILENKKIVVKYIYQNNKGLSAAINNGLKFVEGEFLTWPDADDFLSEDSILKKVKYLLKHKSVAVVTTDAALYRSQNLNEKIGLLSESYPRIGDENQFDLLLNENSIFCPGCHLVRVAYLKEVNPNLEIYNSRLGQNWQLLLPLYYRYNHGFINEPLFNYVIYSDSISHSGNVFWRDKLYKINEKNKILRHTLKKIPMSGGDKLKYNIFVLKKYISQILLLAVESFKKSQNLL